jgi:flagellar protein FlaG
VREALRETAEELKSELAALGRHSLDISFEEENRRYVVQIRDSESGELIRQIPPEHLLEASRRLNELRGLLFDDWS